MNTPFKKSKDNTSSTGHKMDKFEQKLAQDKDVTMAFNVLQALWKAKGEKPMEMVVEIGGRERNGKRANTTRLTVRVTAEYID